MFENLLNSLNTFNPILIYIIILVIPFIENVFPPSPSDTIIVVAGSLIVEHTIHFIPALILTSIGSEMGFLFLYYLGTQTDRKVIQRGRLRFINRQTLDTAEKWFNKYGIIIILFNRFISGVRSVISFFAGMTELDFKVTLVFSIISATVWNIILLTLGILFGENVQLVDKYLNTYYNVVIIILIVVAALYSIRYFYKKRKSNSKGKD
ncbi:MAG: DedA family protein [Ignavibacterium sp.]